MSILTPLPVAPPPPASAGPSKPGGRSAPPDGEPFASVLDQQARTATAEGLTKQQDANDASAMGGRDEVPVAGSPQAAVTDATTPSAEGTDPAALAVALNSLLDGTTPAPSASAVTANASAGATTAQTPLTATAAATGIPATTVPATASTAASGSAASATAAPPAGASAVPATATAAQSVAAVSPAAPTGATATATAPAPAPATAPDASAELPQAFAAPAPATTTPTGTAAPAASTVPGPGTTGTATGSSGDGSGGDTPPQPSAPVAFTATTADTASGAVPAAGSGATAGSAAGQTATANATTAGSTAAQTASPPAGTSAQGAGTNPLPLAGQLFGSVTTATAANAAAATTGRPVTLDRAIETVRLALRAGSERGVTHARISLSPAELGGIEIHLRHTADGLLARVIADSAGAAQVLQQSAGDLRRQLEQQGLNLLRLDIGASGEQAGQTAAQRGFDGAADASGRTARDAGPEDELLTVATGAAPAPGSSLQLPNGALVDVLA
jgi:flagellar hook-length control protein FliK